LEPLAMPSWSSVVGRHGDAVAPVGQPVRRIEGNSASALEPDDTCETCPRCRFIDEATQRAHRTTVPACACASVPSKM